MAPEAFKSPGHQPEAPPVPIGLTADSLWESLTSEPDTGVAIVTLEGELCYANDQAAKLFFGADATAGQYAGMAMKDLFPAKMVRERLEILRHVLESGKPVALRSIWRGNQHLTLIRYIEGEVSELGEDGACDSPPHFLFIVRRAVGDAATESLVDESKYEFLESEVMELGPLDVLTPRELEVLALLGQGLSLKEIAKTLFRTVKTMEKHRGAIGMKLAAHDRVKLAEIAQRAGLTTRDAVRERV